jgi:hypothetical protein
MWLVVQYIGIVCGCDVEFMGLNFTVLLLCVNREL